VSISRLAGVVGPARTPLLTFPMRGSPEVPAPPTGSARCELIPALLHTHSSRSSSSACAPSADPQPCGPFCLYQPRPKVFIVASRPGTALEESRGSCNDPERSAVSDRRIDRPPLRERSPSGRVCPAHGQAGVDGHAGVCGGLRPGRVSGRRPHTGHQRGHGRSLRQPPQTCNSCGRSRTRSGPLLSQATAVLLPACRPDTAASRRADGRRVPRGRGRPVRVVSAAACDHVRVRPTGRLRRRPMSTMRADLAVTRPCGVRQRILPQPAGVRRYRKRSPDRRPLVGCSHRRYASPTWRASRSRSCSRT
jgi:hypothetical protein